MRSRISARLPRRIPSRMKRRRVHWRAVRCAKYRQVRHYSAIMGRAPDRHPHHLCADAVRLVQQEKQSVLFLAADAGTRRTRSITSSCMSWRTSFIKTTDPYFWALVGQYMPDYESAAAHS